MLDLTAKYYPREVYSINENVTRENMRKYDENINEWYDLAEKLYPNFYRLPREEKEKAAKNVDQTIGFCRGTF